MASNPGSTPRRQGRGVGRRAEQPGHGEPRLGPAAPPRGSRRSKEETTTRSAQPGSATAAAAARGRASSPSLLISTLTIIPSHGRQGVGEQRHVVGQVPHPGEGHRPHPGDGGVVVDHQSAVGAAADVELHPVGPQPTGLGEGRQRVLGPEPCGPPRWAKTWVTGPSPPPGRRAGATPRPPVPAPAPAPAPPGVQPRCDPLAMVDPIRIMNASHTVSWAVTNCGLTM